MIDKVGATNGKVDRLITRHAIEHAAFVDAIADHEMRQRVLEQILEPPTTDNSEHAGKASPQIPANHLRQG